MDDTAKHERVDEHPDGCSCDVCDCTCSEHCPVHVPITRDQWQRIVTALHPEVVDWVAMAAKGARLHKLKPEVIRDFDRLLAMAKGQVMP